MEMPPAKTRSISYFRGSPQQITPEDEAAQKRCAALAAHRSLSFSVGDYALLRIELGYAGATWSEDLVLRLESPLLEPFAITQIWALGTDPDCLRKTPQTVKAPLPGSGAE